MENINYKSVVKALLQLVATNYYNEEDEDLRPEHFTVAEYLLEKLENVGAECMYVDENENSIDSEDASQTIKHEPHCTLPLHVKKEIVNTYDKKKGKWKFSTFQHRYPAVKHKSDIAKWRRHILQGGTKKELLHHISQHTFECFVSCREDYIQVHDEDLRKFALQKAQEYPLFKFVACDSWLLKWKKKHHISSRKIQKFVSSSAIRSHEELLKSAEIFRRNVRNKLASFEESNVWNTDQVGFTYELVSSRTLSYTGERRTLGSAYSPKNKLTHSYTVQYIIAMDGAVIGECFICLQEVKGVIPVGAQNQIVYPNLVVTSSKSGKLSTSLVKYFLEKVVKPNAKGNVLYTLDHWCGQTAESLYDQFCNDEVKMEVLLIPEGTTDLVQPLDLYFHRQLKYAVRQFYSHVRIYKPIDYQLLCSRDGILRIHSLVHFLFCSPLFQNLIRYSWCAAGILLSDNVQETVKAICFSHSQPECSVSDCREVSFVTCSWCGSVLCFNDFFHAYHVVNCSKSILAPSG